MGRAVRMDLSRNAWPVRAAVNLVYLTASLAIALLVKSYLL